MASRSYKPYRSQGALVRIPPMLPQNKTSNTFPYRYGVYNSPPIWCLRGHCIPHVVYCPTYRCFLLTFAYLRSSSSKDLYSRPTKSRSLPHQKPDNSCTISSPCGIYLGSPSNPPFYPVSIPTHIYRVFLLLDRSVPFLLRTHPSVALSPSFQPTINTAIALFFSLPYYLISYIPEPN